MGVDVGTDREFSRTIDIVITNKQKFDKRANRALIQAVQKIQGKSPATASMATERLNHVLVQATSYSPKRRTAGRM